MYITSSLFYMLMQNLAKGTMAVSGTLMLKRFAGKYISIRNLKKYKEVDDLQILDVPDDLYKSKYRDYEEQQIENKELEGLFRIFDRRIKEVSQNKDLEYYYNNLDYFQIKKFPLKYRLLFMLSFINPGGGYDIINNDLLFFGNHNFNSITIFHELLHMSSTFFDKKNKIITSGFYQVKILDNKKCIKSGLGLNEGVTQYLTMKIFGDFFTEKNKKRYGEVAYQDEQKIAASLASIVGDANLLSYYQTANLNGLIEELARYTSLEEAKSFIKSVDLLTKYLNYKDLFDDKLFKNVKELKTFINSFLYRCLVQSYSEKYKNDPEKLKELLDFENIKQHLPYDIMERDIIAYNYRSDNDINFEDGTKRL